MELDHYFFSNFGLVLETLIKFCETEPNFLEILFCLKNGKMGQTKTKGFLEFLGKLDY